MITISERFEASRSFRSSIVIRHAISFLTGTTMDGSPPHFSRISAIYGAATEPVITDAFFVTRGRWDKSSSSFLTANGESKSGS